MLVSQIKTSGVHTVQEQCKPRDAAVKYYRYRTFIILGPAKSSGTVERKINHSLKNQRSILRPVAKDTDYSV